MIRAAPLIAAIVAALILVAPAQAQPFGALARLLPDQTGMTAEARAVDLTLGLSQAVPFRVYTVADPMRVVVDFREVAFDDFDLVLRPTGPVTGIAAGPAAEPGWSRLVLTLATPMLPEIVAMTVDPATAEARVSLRLAASSGSDFVAASRPADAMAAPEPALPETRRDVSAPLVIVLDPGHGGVDPGAVRGGVTEADLVLTFARELRDRLRRTGRVEVVLTREADVFVPLPTRLTIARAAGADALISIHADALAEGRARGATVYTLSDTASDAAAAALAEQHDRADLVQGVDLGGTDDVVAEVLMDLARLDVAPQSAALADTLVARIDAADIRLHSRPRGEAGFTVLRAADIPSVLLEIGYISDGGDLSQIQDPDWRGAMQDAMVEAVLTWADDVEARRALLRQ